MHKQMRNLMSDNNSKERIKQHGMLVCDWAGLENAIWEVTFEPELNVRHGLIWRQQERQVSYKEPRAQTKSMVRLVLHR